MPCSRAAAFNLWHYRTDGYPRRGLRRRLLRPGRRQPEPGDLMVLQTVDALALVPIRSGPVLGTGVTLDGAVGPLSLLRAVAHRASASARRPRRWCADHPAALRGDRRRPAADPRLRQRHRADRPGGLQPARPNGAVIPPVRPSRSRAAPPHQLLRPAGRQRLPHPGGGRGRPAVGVTSPQLHRRHRPRALLLQRTTRCGGSRMAAR